MEPELLLVLVSVTVMCCAAFIIGLQRWKTNTWETTPSLKLMTC